MVLDDKDNIDKNSDDDEITEISKKKDVESSVPDVTGTAQKNEEGKTSAEPDVASADDVEVLEASDVAEPDSQAEVQKEDFKDKYLRLYAEFENYKKRSERENTDFAKYGYEKILKEILIVQDHMERALTHADPKKGVKAVQEGLTLIHKELESLLKRFGCQEVSTVGEVFDPQYHEAIHQEYDPKFKSGTVIKEYQKGYLFHERLLRAARVSVATEKPVIKKH